MAMPHHKVVDAAKEWAPFASITMAPKQSASATSSSSAPSDKPLTDVVAGALARAGSQSTIHPLDTLKVRIQAGKKSFGITTHAAGLSQLQRALLDFGSLYKGVFGAASGAGIIIGSYFAFYSNAKRILRNYTTLAEGSIAFISGGIAAVGSSLVKVPIAVCIRSVQAGIYPNAIDAAKSITRAVGIQGLFTGFLPTLLEDVPDMAVKFAVYESCRVMYKQLTGDQPSAFVDLLMGGTAGAAAAAATTPLDVIKTRMMCSASQRPTIMQAIRGVIEEESSWRAFFKGVGPRSLSNGLNSAIFFCFFEAIRRTILDHQRNKTLLELHDSSGRFSASSPSSANSSGNNSSTTASISLGMLGCPLLYRKGTYLNPDYSISCLSLAVPLPLCSKHSAWGG